MVVRSISGVDCEKKVRDGRGTESAGLLTPEKLLLVDPKSQSRTAASVSIVVPGQILSEVAVVKGNTEITKFQPGTTTVGPPPAPAPRPLLSETPLGKHGVQPKLYQK
jgi:hypothetical protein